jgi:hypothetical protein
MKDDNLNGSHTAEYWDMVYKEGSATSDESIQQTSEGGYVVAGNTSFGVGGLDIWVCKLDHMFTMLTSLLVGFVVEALSALFMSSQHHCVYIIVILPQPC